MTIPSTYQRTVKGSGGTVVGGAAIGITQTANNPMTATMAIKDRVVSGTRRMVSVKASTGGAYEARSALSGGSIGYNPTSSQWIASLITSHVNGTANSTLKLTASDLGQNRKIVKPIGNQFGAKVNTAWRQNAWVTVGIADQRPNWSSSAASVSSGGILSTLSGTTMKSTTSAVTAANDKAVGDITVPGRLSYMDGSPNPTADAYPVFTGP